MNNLEIASLLRKIAAAYIIKNEISFKIRAYENAADAIEHSTSEVKDLWDEGKLDTIPGVGKSIASYLDELFQTGKVRHFEEVMRGVPEGMFELLEVPGIGPKTAYKLTKNLQIRSISDLEKMAKWGRISKIPGFGKRTEEEILTSIEQYRRQATGRLLLPYAYELAQKVLSELKKFPAVLEAHPLGSLRRMVATVGDIDIAVASKEPSRVIQQFCRIPGVKRVLEKGENKASIVMEAGSQVDLMVGEPGTYGALLQHFTGSKNHNIHLRELANKMDLSLSEYGIKTNGKVIKTETEEKFYEKLKMQWIPPEIREDTGEIEASCEHKLPKLVELKDIRGDLHLHSDYPIEPSHDPGANPMEEIIKRASELGYEYIGLSDHSPSVSNHTPEEITKLVLKRKEYIEQLKYSTKSVRVLNMLEVDILANGKLAILDNLLASLDLVMASVHSSLRQSKEEMTRRVLNALENPHVDILGHPTCRLLNEREGIELDWEKIFEACKKYHKVLEINAFPNRLDLPDHLVREAVKNGVKMVINTDAHHIEQMDLMNYGVAVARRGWARKKDIINTFSWVDFAKFFKIQY